MNPYKILGVSRETCTDEEVKKAYRNKAKLLHPDQGGDPQEFQELKAAYELIKSKTKRDSFESGETDTIRVEALNLIGALFNELLYKSFDRYMKTSFLVEIELRLKEGLDQISKELQEIRTKSRSLNDRLGVVFLKPGKQERALFDEVIEHNLKQLGYEKKKLKSVKKVHITALRILRNFEESSDWDDVEPQALLMARDSSDFRKILYSID